MQLKFLITGCHGDLAFSIAQIIKKNFKKAKILGTDIETNGIGNVIFDEIYKVPRVNSSRYFDEILKISKSVNVIIPSTEKEILATENEITYLESIHENYFIGMNVFRTAKGGRNKISA